MRIPYHAHILVADGRRMILLRNTGTPDAPKLEVEREEEHPSPPDRDQKSDAAGRAMGMQSGAGSPTAQARGSAMEETDFHQQEEDRFIHAIAEQLNADALAGRIDNLVVVAPPRALGELRKHWRSDLAARISAQIAKDLTTIPRERLADDLVALEE